MEVFSLYLKCFTGIIVVREKIIEVDFRRENEILNAEVNFLGKPLRLLSSAPGRAELRS